MGVVTGPSICPNGCESLIMKPDYENELERFIQQRLRDLPDRQAPLSLIPRVQALIQAREQRAWWKRPIFQWPAAAQGAAILMFLGIISSGAFAVPWLWQHTSALALSPWAAGWMEPLAGIKDVVVALGRASWLVLNSLSQPWVIGSVVVIGLMYLACIGLGTACVRAATHRKRL